MKNHGWVVLLGAEGLLCAAAALFIPMPLTGGLAIAEQFPLAQVGALLRALSLWGGIGNAFAIALYVLICCVPALFAVAALFRRKGRIEDILLGVMSAYLFFAVYLMINPADIKAAGLAVESIGKSVLGGVFWSVLICWLALRLTRSIKNRNSESLLKLMNAIFAITAAAIVFFIAFVHLADLKAAIHNLEAGNTSISFSINPVTGEMTEADGLMPTKAFMVLRYLIAQIPAVMDILILFSAKKLTRLLKEDRYGEGVLGASKKLAGLCKSAVVAIIISSVAVNLLQLLFAGSLSATDYTLVIPLPSIILALGALLLSRYLAESRALKRENEMFV